MENELFFAQELYNESFLFGEEYGRKQDREGINERIETLKKTMKDPKSELHKIIIEDFNLKLDEELKNKVINTMLKVMEEAYISGFDKGFKEARQSEAV